jgi:hypothetical protein
MSQGQLQERGKSIAKLKVEVEHTVCDAFPVFELRTLEDSVNVERRDTQNLKASWQNVLDQGQFTQGVSCMLGYG